MKYCTYGKRHTQNRDGLIGEECSRDQREFESESTRLCGHNCTDMLVRANTARFRSANICA